MCIMYIMFIIMITTIGCLQSPRGPSSSRPRGSRAWGGRRRRMPSSSKFSISMIVIIIVISIIISSSSSIRISIRISSSSSSSSSRRRMPRFRKLLFRANPLPNTTRLTHGLLRKLRIIWMPRAGCPGASRARPRRACGRGPGGQTKIDCYTISALLSSLLSS